MRQKEVMGQSIRTSKSARPGIITYVPIDKSEFRSTVSSDKKKNKILLERNVQCLFQVFYSLFIILMGLILLI